MSDDLRSLLADVAEGRIDPADAARMIDQLSGVDPAPGAAAGPASGPGADVPPGPAGSPGEGSNPARGFATSGGSAESGPAYGSVRGATDDAAADSDAFAAGNVRVRPPGSGEESDAVERVLIQASARPVRVVADHTVDVISAEGPHTVHREGNALRVEAGSPGNASATDSAPPGAYRFERRGGVSRWLAQATMVGVPLLVRVNPMLRVELEIMAGSVDLMGLQGPFAFSVTAGSLRATDCAGPFTGSVRAGSARLELRPTAGASSVRVESGSVDLRLLAGSDVRIRARAELGEVRLKAADGTARPWLNGSEGLQEVVLGAGTASVDLEAIMGSIRVRTP